MKKILVITDEKKSSINQCDSLIKSYTEGKEINLKYKVIFKKKIHLFPNLIIYYLLLIKSLFKNDSNIHDYDLIISCGRISAPYSLLIKKMNGCKNIHILDPYFFREKFDIIILPSHDTLNGYKSENIIKIIGTFVNKQKPLRSQIKKYKNIFHKKKVVSCLVGGDGKSSKLSKKNIINCVKKINNINDKYSIVYCFSRRTSRMVKDIVQSNKKKDHMIFDYEIINPYWYLIKQSQYFIVTEDSVSMISDAISTGKPVYIQEIDSVKKKIRFFIKSLKDKGFVRSFRGNLENWDYTPLNESSRVAKIIGNLI